MTALPGIAHRPASNSDRRGRLRQRGLGIKASDAGVQHVDTVAACKGMGEDAPPVIDQNTVLLHRASSTIMASVAQSLCSTWGTELARRGQHLCGS